MAVIRASTIEFTPEQKYIIEKIEKEYEEWYNPNRTQMVNYFDKYVTELRDTFYEQVAQEEDFFESQKILYSCVYRALTRYPFPYSDKQISLLESFKKEMEWATGDPTQMADISLMEELQKLMSLMEKKDFKNCSTYYVDCTVEYYVQQIINDLYYPAQNELVRRVPEGISEMAIVNVASYVIMELKSNFHGVHHFCHIDLFHLGLSQIYTRMMNMFRFSGLLFTERQRELMKGLIWEIEDVVRHPTNGKYEMLHLGFYGFMNELRGEHQERETKEVDGVKVIDEEGRVTKAIKKIMREFYELQVAADEHHRHFVESIAQVPDITKTMFKYFLIIFPPIQKIPFSFMLPTGYYVSTLAREWVHQP